MQSEFWLERWQKGEIGFHQADGNDLLAKHWPALDLAPGARVLVPLCGKSVDIVWLAAQGFRVVGAELSEQAVTDFFREQNLAPEIRKDGAFTVYSAGPIEIWCGDFFELPTAAVSEVTGVYDRAALIALTPDLKARYVAKLNALLDAGTKTLLIALTYPQAETAGPPFSTPEAEVRGLFAATHDIAIAESRDALASSRALKERGITSLLEAAYVLHCR